VEVCEAVGVAVGDDVREAVGVDDVVSVSVHEGVLDGDAVCVAVGVAVVVTVNVLDGVKVGDIVLVDEGVCVSDADGVHEDEHVGVPEAE
jgi:NAD(P)H-nitrite reductase large subunit